MKSIKTTKLKLPNKRYLIERKLYKTAMWKSMRRSMRNRHKTINL